MPTLSRLTYDIQVKFIRRPCLVDGVKAFWHQWQTKTTDAIYMDGRLVKTIEETVGLVEYEDGTMHEAGVDSIRFVDGGDFAETSFGGDEC